MCYIFGLEAERQYDLISDLFGCTAGGVARVKNPDHLAHFLIIQTHEPKRLPAELDHRAALEPWVPFPLDLHEGRAVLSLVPFLMDRIRFRNLPGALTTWTSLWEINLRTYVRVGGVPGIYFLTLETPHRLGNLIARTAFHLPYRYARVKVRHHPEGGRIDAQVARPGGGLQPLSLAFEREAADPGSSFSSSDPFQGWITERYHLFVEKNGRAFRGDVHHEPWRVKRIKLQALSGGIATVPVLPDPSSLESCFEAEPLGVRFQPFLEIRDNSLLAKKIP